ncbi:hypothetical protein G7Z17_g10925 [Cylindrodendrum hubeiense]|uniref:tRNA(Ile)-lysidine synthetase n=1 Tax=Cylindrodendrum hubeiense TaxID=595255 RepID=A0A9P5H0J6_9HYPO|nr:hypothetical protein G7Z17_g10925 [Cylindrodendrum hubeiense]
MALHQGSHQKIYRSRHSSALGTYAALRRTACKTVLLSAPPSSLTGHQLPRNTAARRPKFSSGYCWSPAARPTRNGIGLNRRHNGMGTVAHAYNHVSRPIALTEFREAIEAVCRPRFPMARSARPQRIVMAISGGVDSMAMAFLVSKLLRTFRGNKIADNPAYGAIASVIDHQLRDGSSHEAAQVAKELRKLDIKATVTPLSWKDERSKGLNPSELPNLEGLARTYRYRALGNICNYLGATSLFFAHHRDDQYETVLMRLLGGHGYRGLQGIREANSIPECYDMHGVYKSGLIDDQLKANPALSFRPALREMKRLRSIFRDEKLTEPWGDLRSQFRHLDLAGGYPEYGTVEKNFDVPYLKPLETEDGGVMIYRPLLEFDKARLIATCEANNVTWFEDHTNLDPTLTTRNAIRYLVRNHKLPKALEKPSILALAKRAKRRTEYEEAEAYRYLVREAIVKDFDPNAGTLLIEIPTTRVARRRGKRHSLNLENKPRKEHRKLIMSIAVRKLMDFVTPEFHLPPLPNLENVVYRLYPHLAPKRGPPPKTFAMAGILFDPVVTGTSVKWSLTRAPYTSNQPLPVAKLHGSLDHRLRPTKEEMAERGESPHQARPLGWKKANLFDGRFWIRIGYNNRGIFRVQPFRPEDGKVFRKTLSPLRRAKLERLLKHYAPGKVRYTLPALYGVERERDHYSQHVTQTVTLLALPTLGIHIPGLERWVRYEVRYKKVDTTLLGHEPRGEKPHVGRYRPLYGAMRKQKQRRMYKYRERR